MTIDINPDLYAQVPDEHGRLVFTVASLLPRHSCLRWPS